MTAVGAPTLGEHPLDLIAQPSIRLLMRADITLAPGIIAAGGDLQCLTPRLHAQGVPGVLLLDHRVPFFSASLTIPMAFFSTSSCPSRIANCRSSWRTRAESSFTLAVSTSSGSPYCLIQACRLLLLMPS